ncbi:hypothetical protein [Acinetobacter guillouiae]|uniref:hypothetical protein n=1 Tax=Acinetobacter guillouiae TaxID=106649 RepID=UPI0012500597|nr:hypothetical protein [Acinetobacter guillouiae]
MKYFKKNGQVYAFDSDGSQDELITNDFIKMTKNEIDRHVNPEKYLSETEKYEIYLNSLWPLTRRQFMHTLVQYEVDDELVNAINNIEDVKQRKMIKIDFETSQNFERLSESILFMFNLLNIEESKVNSMWEYGLSI